MAQQFDYPKTETELREIQDKLYQHSKEAHDAGGCPAFKGLLEIMSAEATITLNNHRPFKLGKRQQICDNQTPHRGIFDKPHIQDMDFHALIQ